MTAPAAVAPVSLPTAVPLAAAGVSGALVALQQRINGDLGQELGDPLLAVFGAFASGVVVLVPLVLVRRSTRAALRKLPAVPWCCRLGGLGGASLHHGGAAASLVAAASTMVAVVVSGVQRR